MRGRFLLSGCLSLLSLLVVGCVQEAPRTSPPPPPPQPILTVTVLSTPPKATISLKDQPVGYTPQSIAVSAASELLQLNATLGPELAAEKRIRFVTPEHAEVMFLFGKDRSPLARSLGLSRVLVFDYGEGITFDVNQHELRPVFATLLERQAEMLKAHFTGLDIYVCGHTDSSGSDAHNLALSLARAQTVANRLTALGVPRSRLKVQGFGSAFPIATNDTPEGKALNRRTEIILPQ